VSGTVALSYVVAAATIIAAAALAIGAILYWTSGRSLAEGLRSE
jgi:hypothetical protein